MIDLHLHTIYSDGASSVEDILRAAQEVGLSVISITDHGNVDAYKELNDERIRGLFKGEILNGVEITTHYKGEVIEILAYKFDMEIMKRLLAENVLCEEEKHIKEFPIIKEKFDKLGIKYNVDNVISDLERKNKHCKTIFYKEFIKYPENNKFLLNSDAIKRAGRFIRDELNNPKSKLFINQTSLLPSLDEAITMVHEAGGLAFLAHPFAYSSNIIESLEDMTREYKLDGVEALYTTKSQKQANYIIQFCDKNNLLKCGGSDYHGAMNRKNKIGTGYGCMRIPRELIKDWH